MTSPPRWFRAPAALLLLWSVLAALPSSVFAQLPPPGAAPPGSAAPVAPPAASAAPGGRRAPAGT
ncbi:MAG TPA: hypothetical protein VFS43_29225, partial [Polyangiaceae bacterium]|nr:hypothetical protein [Polyangiaceae bacterium]